MLYCTVLCCTASTASTVLYDTALPCHLSCQILAEAAHFIPGLQGFLPASIAAVSPAKESYSNGGAKIGVKMPCMKCTTERHAGLSCLLPASIAAIVPAGVNAASSRDRGASTWAAGKVHNHHSMQSHECGSCTIAEKSCVLHSIKHMSYQVPTNRTPPPGPPAR